MHSDIPDISITTSDGIINNNDIYFILNYKIFTRPQGIARFPDGGKAKLLLNDFYIMKYKKNEKIMKPVASIVPKKIDLKLRTTKLSKKANSIDFLVSFSVNDPSRSIWGENLYKFDIETQKILIDNDNIKTFKPLEKSKIIKRKETSKLFNHIFDYTGIGLKNPMDFIKKNDRTLKNLIINRDGNERFRLVVIGYIISKNKYNLLDEIKEKNTDKRTAEIIEKITSDLNNKAQSKKNTTAETNKKD